MSTLEEVIKECHTLRSRIKTVEEILTVLQRSSRGSADTLRRLEEAEANRAEADRANTAVNGFRPVGGAVDEDSDTSSQQLGRHSEQVLTSLSRHVLHSDVAEGSVWFRALFPETCIYTLPVGAVKNGRIPSFGFDPVLAELVRRGRLGSASARDVSAYQAYSSEWPVLNQSITYQVIQAEVTSELIVLLEHLFSLPAEQAGEALLATPLRSELDLLLQLQSSVLDDQTKRASVLIAAARKSVAVANSISNQLGSEASGVHPSVEAAYAAAKASSDFPSGSSAGKSSKAPAGKPWRGPKPAPSSAAASKTPPASAAKRAKSPGATAPP